MTERRWRRHMLTIVEEILKCVCVCVEVSTVPPHRDLALRTGLTGCRSIPPRAANSFQDFSAGPAKKLGPFETKWRSGFLTAEINMRQFLLAKSKWSANICEESIIKTKCMLRKKHLWRNFRHLFGSFGENLSRIGCSFKRTREF